jgi:choline dehydrogenase-like flavoprotein
LDNLYVVDTSFFVSANAINPTLTTVANAMRVGDHLIERLGARVAPAEGLAPRGNLDPHKDGEALA